MPKKIQFPFTITPEILSAVTQIEAIAQKTDLYQSELVYKLDLKQRYVLSLFADYQVVTARQIAEFLNYKPRTIRILCAKWVESGFLKVAEPSKKARKYVLSSQYESLLMTLNKKFF